MKGHVASRPLLLVMMLVGAAPQSCPPNCKFCSTGLAECDPVSSLQQVLPGIPSLTEKILLRNGNLSTIHSAAFQNFSRLQLLSITGCLVSSLANMTFVTGEGSNLQSLDLSNNQLQSCRVDTLAFAGLARLEELILTNNAVDALKKSWFLDLNSLTKLLVSENKIAYLPPRTFESLMKLNHLAVAANQIQYLSTGTFSGLDSLTELDLSRNHILFIDEHTFKPLKTLRKLWLVRNRLVTLPSIPETIEKVSLHENPWECTCELVNIVLSLKEKVQNPSSLLCDRPENLRGQQVVNVGPDICINATTPGENLQQQSSTSLDPLYSFIDDLPTKKVPHLPAEHFCNQNSTQMDDITNTESGLVKYFETQHEEKVMESMTCSEAPQHYPDALKSPVAHMKSIVKNNANDELGQKNLSKKCKTWSTFCNVASHSIVGQTTLEEQSHDFGDNLNPSNGNEDFSKRKHGDHLKSEESTNSLGSGKSTDMTDSPRNGRFTEPSGTLRNDRSADLIDSLSNGRSEAPSDSQRNGRSTEMSGEHSISQRELVSFFSSVDSLSSDSGDSYDEQDIEETEDLDSNLPPGESSQSTFAKLGKPEKSEDGLTLPETDSKRSSVKAKSADNCARREGTHHTRVGSIDTSYAESVGRRELRSKKHKMGVSLARDELLTERFWKFHTNCCDEYKPCPTAKKVLGHLKATGVESSNHDSVRMTKEHFWKYHTSCCDEYKPCPTAKKVLHHLRKAPTGKLSNAYVRLTRERFWKYHRNCCDDYKPCPTAKKVMQRLKAAPSGQVDTNSIQSPPSDNDLLEDQHTFPLLSPKHVNGDEARAERDNKRPQSKNVISLPNLQMHLTHAGLYCAQNHCVSSERISCGVPRLVTVEPAQPGSTPQELSYGIYHHEERTKVQPRTEMQDFSLEPPGNHECLLMASSVEDQMDTPHGTSRCCPPLVGCTNTNASAKLQRGSAKTISHVSVASGGSNCGNLEAAGKSVTIEPPTTLRNHLQLSRVAFSDQASCGHPSSLPPVSGGTLNQNADEESSKVECKVQVEHVTETLTSTDVSSDEDVQNLPRKEKITGTLSFGKAEGESRSKVVAAIHVKATGRYDPGGLVGAIDPTDSCTRLYGGTIFNASSNVKKYTMQNATNSLRRSSLKYAHNRVGFTPDPLLNNLCDKYANQPDEMKEQSCNDYALRNNPTVEGFAYKREMPKSHNLRKIVANDGNHRNVQEQGFHPTSRKPSAIRKDNHFCMGRENLCDSKDSNHTGRLCRRSAEKDVHSEETEQARGAPLPKSCLVADSKKKTKTKLNEYFLAKFARKTYHSVFNLPTGIPPCHSENASPVCPEVTKEEPDSILEPIEMKAAPGSTLMHKETEHNMGQVSTASEKDPEERTPYLSSLYRTTHQRKHTHDYFFKESDPALLEISELSVLSNLHFCKITEKTAFNAKEKEGNDSSGQENNEGDSPGTFDPVPSCSGHQYTPPTREELMGDSELAVINMLCNLKKSIDLSGELLILGNIKS